MWVYVYVNTCICACVWVQCVYVEARSLKLMSGIPLDQPLFPYKLRQGFSEYLANLDFFHRPPCQPGVYMGAEDFGMDACAFTCWPIVLIFTFVSFAKSLPWSSLLHSLAFEVCQCVASLSSLALLSISLHNRMYEMKLLAYFPLNMLFFFVLFSLILMCTPGITPILRISPRFLSSC